MASILAYTMGCPQTTNHLYERVFKTEAMSGSYGPGSTYNKLNQDCGYQTTNNENETGLYEGQPPIMHDNQMYRLVLNATVWGAFSWSLILDDKAEYNLLHINNNHGINYPEDSQLCGKQRRNDTQALNAYVFERYSAFIGILGSDEIFTRKIDSNHFANEFLYELFNVCNEVNRPLPVDMKAHYVNMDEAIRYENELEKIFEEVNKDYNCFRFAIFNFALLLL